MAKQAKTLNWQDEQRGVNEQQGMDVQGAEES